MVGLEAKNQKKRFVLHRFYVAVHNHNVEMRQTTLCINRGASVLPLTLHVQAAPASQPSRCTAPHL